MSRSIVMQPKSSATVVVVLVGTCPVRSISVATEVMAASVVNGRISEMADTAVVLPTPNPPAMTIFTGVGARGGRPEGSVYFLESTDHPHDHVQVFGEPGSGPPDGQVTSGGQIRDQHPRHPDMEPELGRNLCHRHRRAAQGDDVP